ncbi:MAG: hypothetical protein ABSH56_03355 [Bryobacteraceae bacterium]|jgi:hypothetical protein
MNVRGERYHIHEPQALLDVLAPHSDVLIRLFSIDAATIVAELEKILYKLTRGLGEALMALDELRHETADRPAQTAEDADKHSEDLLGKVLEDPGGSRVYREDL